jgi:hypothetical protein
MSHTHTEDQLVEQPELEQFFAGVSYRLELAETTQRRLDQILATRFNVFKLIEPDENKLSDILADLLDPKGSHGQCDLFLRRLFEILGHGAMAKLATDITVRREAPTNKIEKYRRRIDILVEAGTEALLAIENKVDSPEQTDQVKDYLEHLRQSRRRQPMRGVLIYLSRNGEYPRSLPTAKARELQQEGTLFCWSYADEIRGWLETCRRDCEAERIRGFLSDFIAYIEASLRRISEHNKETLANEK